MFLGWLIVFFPGIEGFQRYFYGLPIIDVLDNDSFFPLGLGYLFSAWVYSVTFFLEFLSGLLGFFVLVMVVIVTGLLDSIFGIYEPLYFGCVQHVVLVVHLLFL